MLIYDGSRDFIDFICSIVENYLFCTYLMHSKNVTKIHDFLYTIILVWRLI